MNVKFAFCALPLPFGISLMAVSAYSSSFSKASINLAPIFSSFNEKLFTTFTTLRVLGSRFVTELIATSSRFSSSAAILSIFFWAITLPVPPHISKTAANALPKINLVFISYFFYVFYSLTNNSFSSISFSER